MIGFINSIPLSKYAAVARQQLAVTALPAVSAACGGAAVLVLGVLLLDEPDLFLPLLLGLEFLLLCATYEGVAEAGLVEWRLHIVRVARMCTLVLHCVAVGVLHVHLLLTLLVMLLLFLLLI